MSGAEVKISVENPDRPDVHRLIDELNTYLLSLYRVEECHHLTIGELAGDDVTFFTARIDGELVGCGALRRLDHTMSEIKRMYVLPRLQGRGIGGQILDAIERHGLDQGAGTLVLETGAEQPDALALYRKYGFTERGAYIGYPENGVSIFMEKRINS
jgi:putative acetyltransferase